MRTLPALILGALLPHFTAAGEIDLHGRTFVEVRSKSELPEFIRSSLKMDAEGSSGVADIGLYFSKGDVIDGPTRGLIGAAHNGDTWIVALGIIGGWQPVHLQFSIFENSTLIAQRRTGNWGGAASLADSIAGIGKPSATLAGDFFLDWIAVGSPKSQTGTLGPPVTTATAKGESKIQYKNLTVWFNEQSVVTRILSSNPNYCLEAICPGTSLNVVAIVLGAPLHGDQVVNGVNNYSLEPLRFEPPPSGDSIREPAPCQADITITRDVVTTIEVSCRQ